MNLTEHVKMLVETGQTCLFEPEPSDVARVRYLAKQAGLTVVQRTGRHGKRQGRGTDRRHKTVYFNVSTE